jgi:acetylornithine deacetylase/succinyl-diaminopimelate desuccinylase-like protein
MYDMLRAKNTLTRQRVITFTRELVRLPSPSLSEESVADLVEGQMKAIGYDEVIRDDAGNVVGILRGLRAGPTVLLNSHMDTVSSDAEGRAWTMDPHEGLIRNGRLYGLGATDCKGGLAAQVFVGDLLKRSLLPFTGTLVVAATVAEENGCSIGVHELMERTLPGRVPKPNYAILGEPTGLGLYYGHDGWAELEVHVEGLDAARVGTATQAVSAELLGGDSSGLPTSNLQSLRTGQTRWNTVKGLRCATIPLDTRVGWGEDDRSVLQRVERTARQAAGTAGDVVVDVAVRRDEQKLYNGTRAWVKRITHAWETEPFSLLMERAHQALSAAGCTFKSGKWRLRRLGMGTAGGVLLKEFQVPTIGYGPGQEEVAHAADEYVETVNLPEAVYGTTAIVHSLIGVPVFGWTPDEI